MAEESERNWNLFFMKDIREKIYQISIIVFKCDSKKIIKYVSKKNQRSVYLIN